jgi:hypothetical protein
MIIKTSDLTRKALDYAVLKVQGQDFKSFDLRFMDAYEFSSDWSRGGPLIEYNRIEITPKYELKQYWAACLPENFVYSIGPTPLIAAMRCFVLAQLGTEVDIPEIIVSKNHPLFKI